MRAVVYEPDAPTNLSFGDVAEPVAAVTALQAIRALGPVVGRRVLVTGASGGSAGSPSNWQRAQ